jgi:3',5'-cyclic AMP phosphodiesterase CpdA
MVTFLRRFLLTTLLAAQCLFFGCTVDLLGLFGSTGLSERFAERNNFNFLRPEERTISLEGDYSFIVLSDTHIENGDAFGLEKIRDIIEADDDDEIKFVIIIGDITQCAYKQDINKFIEIARSLPVPCYPVIGNHDIYFNNWSNWKELIGSTCYRIDGGGATLFILDSANAYFGKEQLDWLDSELTSAKAKGRVFAFTHTNFFVESPTELQQVTDARERARVLSILRNRCDVMFSGHLHKRIETEAGGVKFIAIEDFRHAKVYCRVKVSGGGISYQYEKL